VAIVPVVARLEGLATTCYRRAVTSDPHFPRQPLRSRPPEERARALRPEGWTAPGPRPLGDPADPALQPGADEDLSYLLGDFRIFQKKSGHRWSLDDFITAYVALEHVQNARIERAIDLGTGIGSVLSMIAWGLEHATLVGIEAQDASIDLARRSLRYNGLTSRITLRHGDFRDETVVPEQHAFDLVTGTPPYLPLGTGLVSDKIQKEPCFFETRGGVDDYARIAARIVKPEGFVVLCSGLASGPRLAIAAERAGLVLETRIVVVPRHLKAPLLDVGVMRPKASIPANPTEERTFTVRDRDGKLTPEMHAARERMGLPPSRG